MAGEHAYRLHSVLLHRLDEVIDQLLCAALLCLATRLRFRFLTSEPFEVLSDFVIHCRCLPLC